MKWTVSKKPKEKTTILFHLNNICIIASIAYCTRSLNEIQFTKNFLQDQHITFIYDYVKTIIEDLKVEYIVRIIGFEDLDFERQERPSIRQLDIFNTQKFIKNVTKYILTTNFISNIQPLLRGYDIIHSRDSDIHNLKGLVFTHDMNVLIRGKDSIIKKENGIWYSKERADLVNIFILDKIKSLTF